MHANIYYDMAGRPMMIYNIDSNTRKTFADAADKRMRTSDSRKHILEYEYDILQRPVKTVLFLDDIAIPLGMAILSTEYGTAAQTDQNLNGQAAIQYDQSGISTVEAADFKGNPLRTIKQFTQEYKDYIDWHTNTVELLDKTYSNSQTYDALNRPADTSL